MVDYKAELFKACAAKKYSRDSFFEIIHLMTLCPTKAEKEEMMKQSVLLVEQMTEQEAIQKMREIVTQK